MKLFTANFLACAVKSCRTSPASFPRLFRDAEREQQELDFQPEFIRNILSRLDWDALQVIANEVSIFRRNHLIRTVLCSLALKLGFPRLPEKKPTDDSLGDEGMLRDVHKLLLETQVVEGKLVCGNCGHEYMIKEGIPNFLLPSHLGSKDPSIQLITITDIHIIN